MAVPNKEKLMETEHQEVQEQEVVPQSEETKAENPIPEEFKQDLYKWKSQAREKDAKLQELQGKIKSLEEKQLAEKEDYKSLYERVKQEKEELHNKLNQTGETFVNTQKMSKVKEFALQQGIRKEALDDLDMLDLEDIIVETTNTGRMSVVGADDFVSRLKNEKPHWFETRRAPSVNNNPSDFKPGGGSISPSELLELQKNDPAKYKEYMTTKRHLIKRR
jgi:transcription termination factor NusB